MSSAWGEPALTLLLLSLDLMATLSGAIAFAPPSTSINSAASTPLCVNIDIPSSPGEIHNGLRSSTARPALLTRPTRR
jgi:hypothetical protein